MDRARRLRGLLPPLKSKAKAMAHQPATLANPELDARLKQLLADDDYETAIDMAIEANAQNRDPVLEQRIIDMRIRGGMARAGSQDAPPWPPTHAEQFKASEQLPEIDARDLSANALLDGVLGKGGLIVRNLMDADTAQSMREHIDKAFEARLQTAKGEPKEPDCQWYRRSDSVPGGPVQFATLGSKGVTKTGSIWCADCPPAAFDLVQYYEHIGMRNLLEHYFGEPATLSVKKWVLRCIEPNNGAQSGWHQDGRFLGDSTIRSLNLWIALSDCGTGMDAPGIDIVGGADRTIYETGTRGAHFDWTVGQDLVDEVCQRNPASRPSFREGDAVFFDHYNLHRTGFGEQDTKLRYAIESWFFATSTAPKKQHPVLF